jgi:hypothetical protein
MTFQIVPFIVLSSPEKIKKGRDGHGPVHKKGRGQLWSAHGPVFSFSQALWADPPKEAEKAKKSEKAAHVEVTVHNVPLDQSFYLIATGPVNIFFPCRPAYMPGKGFRPASCCQ